MHRMNKLPRGLHFNTIHACPTHLQLGSRLALGSQPRLQLSLGLLVALHRGRQAAGAGAHVGPGAWRRVSGARAAALCPADADSSSKLCASHNNRKAVRTPPQVPTSEPAALLRLSARRRQQHQTLCLPHPRESSAHAPRPAHLGAGGVPQALGPAPLLCQLQQRLLVQCVHLGALLRHLSGLLLQGTARAAWGRGAAGGGRLCGVCVASSGAVGQT